MLNVLWLAAILLALLWMLGMAASYTASGLIHVLLALAIVAVVTRIFAGRSRSS